MRPFRAAEWAARLSRPSGVVLPCRRSVSSGTAEGLSFHRRRSLLRFRAAEYLPALSLLEGVLLAF